MTSNATTSAIPGDLHISAASSSAERLTESQARTLMRLLALIKSSRADAKGKQPAVANAAKGKLISAFGYLLGFLDGKGIIERVNPGFVSVLGPQDYPDTEAAWDQIQKTIEDIANPTKIPVVAWLIGAGIIYAVGAYLLSE